MEFSLIAFSLALFFGALFLFLWFKRPETLWLGFSFLAFLFHFLLAGILLFVQEAIDGPLYAFAFLFALFLFLFPVLVVATFLVNGIKIIRNEGFKWRNTLSIVLGIGLIGYLVLWPLMIDVTENHFLNTVYQVISFSAFYLTVLFICYTVTNLLNLFPIKKATVDYFIVLGAGLIGDQVPPILASRINRGLELQEKQQSGKVLFTGGQGSDELLSEGDAMYQYAVDKGVDEKILLKETASTNTYENLLFSKEIIQADWAGKKPPKIAIVSNNYHVLRALMQARRLGIKAKGYGSKSKFYYSLNAFLREFVAYLSMTYKIHGTVLFFIALTFFALYFILEMLL